jgi:hypothetical protein
MKLITCIAVALASITPLQAQSPKFGLALNLGVPLGEFRESSYWTPDVDSKQIEGYDIGGGVSFTMSFPLQRNLAFRLGLGGMSTKGTNTAYGYDTIYLKHRMFSLGGEFQLFFDDAYRHRGTYIIAGVHGNFERFERSFDDFDSEWYDPYYSEADVSRKTRLGGTLGIGHTFYGSGLNFTTELTYHSTLSDKDFDRGEPVAANFLKVSFGLVF